MTTNPDRVQTDHRTSTNGTAGMWRQTWKTPDPTSSLSTHAYYVIRRLQEADARDGWAFRGFYALMLAVGGGTPGELTRAITELTDTGHLEEGH